MIGQDPNSAVAYAVPATADQVNLEHAFWVWNLVAQFTYGDRAEEASEMVQEEIKTRQAKLVSEAAGYEQEYLSSYASDPVKALETLTKQVVEAGENTTKEWRGVWYKLVSYFRDGFQITSTASSQKQCVPGSGKYKDCVSRLDPNAKESGYDQEWFDRIVADGDNKQHYYMPDAVSPEQQRLQDRKLERLNKQRVRHEL